MAILAKKQRIRNNSYKLPDILNSYESFLQAHNLDLLDMEILPLQQELFKVTQAKTFTDPQRQEWLFLGPGEYVSSLAWLEAREAAIKSELKRRRAERENK